MVMQATVDHQEYLSPGQLAIHHLSHINTRFTDQITPQFNNDFGTDPLFRNEGENRIMVKLNYWFSL